MKLTKIRSIKIYCKRRTPIESERGWFVEVKLHDERDGGYMSGDPEEGPVRGGPYPTLKETSMRLEHLEAEGLDALGKWTRLAPFKAVVLLHDVDAMHSARYVPHDTYRATTIFDKDVTCKACLAALSRASQ